MCVGVCVCVLLYLPSNSVAASVQQARPDLLDDYQFDGPAVPMPVEAPAGLLDKQVFKVVDIGEPTNAVFFTLSKINPASW